jgi:hypothetical protein
MSFWRFLEQSEDGDGEWPMGKGSERTFHDIRPSFVNLRLETDEGTDGFNATCLIAPERITG